MNNLRKIIFTLSLALLAMYAITPVSAAGNFSITPASGTYVHECNSSVIVTINVTSGSSNAADVIINYDPTKIEIIDAIPSIPGVQISTGNAFESYAGNTVNTSTGKIKLIGYSTVSTLTGVAEFASIQFKPLTPAATGGFTFEFTGADPYNTLDSNIADSTTSFDMLTGVSNASYTFSSGACSSDALPPAITFSYPKNFTKNVAANSTISFAISDAASGIDITSIIAYLNGEKYVSSDPEVSITGTPNSYTLIITPRIPIPQGVQSVETVTATDNAGNTRNASITFNIPEGEESVCPEIIKEIKKACPAITPTPSTPPTEAQSPTIIVTSKTTDLKLEKTTVIVKITDDTGIVPESFLLQIGGKTYSLSSTSELISVDGTLYEYTFEVNIDIETLEIDENGKIYGFARATDIEGNTRIENIIFELDASLITDSKTDNNTSGFPVTINSVFSIAIGTLLSIAALFFVIIPAIAPASIQVFNNTTSKAISFPRAYFNTSKGKKSQKFGLINGKLIGYIPKEGGFVTIQKYGFAPQQIAIPNKNSKSKPETIKVFLTKI